MSMDRILEKYITDHSSPEDKVLYDLYRQTHLRFVNPNMSTGYLQGKLLEFLSLMINPELIIEIGTYTGYSAICLAKGLRPGGKLYTIEVNDELTGFSRAYFHKAGIDSSVVQLAGRAQDIIPRLGLRFDLAYIDGDKREYPEYYKIISPIVRPGGFILADNILWGNKVLERETADPQTKGIIEFNELIRNETNIEKLILPIRDGLTLIRKIR